jgi:hypothetical protein
MTAFERCLHTLARILRWCRLPTAAPDEVVSRWRLLKDAMR